MALKPLVLEILLALIDEPRHGWDLVRDVEARMGGEPLLPGNFYRTLRRMLDDRWIAEVPRPPQTDPRRRYFQLTPRGEQVARAEARRLEALIADRRIRRLLRAR